MKRKGLMLLDALMALLLLSALAALMAPLAGSWLTALKWGQRGRSFRKQGFLPWISWWKKSGTTGAPWQKR